MDINVFRKTCEGGMTTMFLYVEVLTDLAATFLLVVLYVWFLRSHDRQHTDLMKKKKKHAT
jgi:uncharacterized membrane protein